MKTVRIAVTTLLFVYWCQSFCTAGPTIELHTGINAVAISIVNGWNRDLAGVSAHNLTNKKGFDHEPDFFEFLNVYCLFILH